MKAAESIEWVRCMGTNLAFDGLEEVQIRVAGDLAVEFSLS